MDVIIHFGRTYIKNIETVLNLQYLRNPQTVVDYQ